MNNISEIKWNKIENAFDQNDVNRYKNMWEALKATTKMENLEACCIDPKYNFTDELKLQDFKFSKNDSGFYLEFFVAPTLDEPEFLNVSALYDKALKAGVKCKDINSILIDEKFRLVAWAEIKSKNTFIFLFSEKPYEPKIEPKNSFFS